MKKVIFALATTAAAIALPAAAHAQAYAGVSGGYHELSVDDDFEDDEDFDGLDTNDGGFIYGVFAGYDVPTTSGFFVGAEGNFHFGDGPIDNEYGLNARLGVADAGGAKYYARAGYQWVDIDPNGIFDTDLPDDAFDGIDTTTGDFLVGAGVEYPLGTNTFLRANVDTVGFDTVRGTAGLGVRF
ncbi:outer membrane beta-barrel protein [Erythrobacter arachoides]|uniref:Outer membrane beta-barrel protein n=1 Tax=Aurantiacibacter arachoides TaxID=1850444 RepID=A0A845A0P7_9SPHN|nr:outer membrane beta-barrel protein [Aurantiacibacter arachoides]MXO93294.1 outer membrane beta-barrel protein [Aurantiacibacter arachoides]GGD50448.1 hypothetical protein GCM10011411_07890 [Aurantiacibacter arachoides]